MADKGGLTYLPGATEANVAYEEALKRLTESLDARKNRLFDPTLLAMAEGFLGPTQTGGFGEALGRAAGKVRGAMAEEEKYEQDIAKAQMGLAQQRLELERQKRIANIAEQHFGGKGSAVPAEGQAVPAGGQADPAANFIQFARLSGMSPAEIELKAVQIRRDANKVTEGGAFNLDTGKFEPFGIKNVDIDIAGQRISVPATIAVQYNDLIKGRKFADAVKLIMDYKQGLNLPTESELAGAKAGAEAGARRAQEAEMKVVQLPLRNGSTGGFELSPQDAFEFQKIVRQFGINSPQALQFAGRFTGEGSLVGGVAPVQTPTGAPEVQAGRIKSESERKAESEFRSEFAKTIAKLGAEKEANLPQAEMSARDMSALANRVLGNLSTSGEFVGLLSRPGLGPALAKLLAEGITTEKGSYKLTAVEEGLLRISGASAKDIANIEKLRGDFSQAELLFTQLYMAKQGAITEGERRIVRMLGGATEMSADAIRTRIALVKERAEFDKKTIADYREWKQRNPDKTFADFQTQPQFTKMLDAYEKKTGALADQNLIEPGRRYEFGGKTYEYIGPANDSRAARNRQNYREVQ